MDELQELKEFKKEGYQLLKQSTLLVTASVAAVKNSDHLNMHKLNAIKTVIDKIKNYRHRIDAIFKDIETTEDLKDDIIKIHEIGNNFTNWVYDFTADVMDELEALKKEFESKNPTDKQEKSQ